MRAADKWVPVQFDRPPGPRVNVFALQGTSDVDCLLCAIKELLWMLYPSLP
jgi:hypothetical protein